MKLFQQAVLELFDSLRGLREHMTREGMSGCGEGIQLQELIVLNVADWPSDEVAQLCRDAMASATNDCIDVINAAPPIGNIYVIMITVLTMKLLFFFYFYC